jgi:purine nucleoside phosphorylase
MDDHDTPQNPIVAMATKIRARRDLGAAIDSATADAGRAAAGDDESRFVALADVLATGTKRLNSILGKNGVTFVRIENPLRLRLRFGAKRVSLDLDRERQLVIVSGLGLDGEYQFDTAAEVPALINLSKLSTEAGYGDALTGSGLLKAISADAELPRPAHLDAPGPMRF